MSSPPRVGMALIVRDEAETIERCLASWWGHVDVAAIVDTGSEDDTVDRIRAFAAERPETELRLGRFEWCDDFSAARNAAERLLDEADVAWRSWIDADDVLHGAEHLRGIAADAPAEVHAFFAGYDYAQDDRGNCICYLRRERLVRTGVTEWAGRLHEAQPIAGPVANIPAELVEWRHRKVTEAHRESSDRNLRILTAWEQDEPENARVLGYLGQEHANRGQHDQAIDLYRRYLATGPAWDEERCQIHRKYARSLLALERHEEARDVALQALTVMPSWPDTYLSLAEACYSMREHAKAVQWAERVLELGAPDTVLIVDPLDYTVQPQLIRAVALGELGRVEDALEAAQQVLAVIDHDQLRGAAAGWQQTLKRERTASTFALCAEQLIGHDEQAKALVLLEQAVPYFATDHPRIVGVRSMLRERLSFTRDDGAYAEHYELGGSKPEDAVQDPAAVCEQLPRAQFLLAGLREQAAEAPVELRAAA